MENISRKELQIINSHSNWSKEELETVLRDNVYNDAPAWQKFLRIFFLGLGASFMAAGIIFFFAYNWKDLHKFTKLGMVEVMIVTLIIVALIFKISMLVKQIIISAASILTGVLFAVFGQIYHTGANAYDFFLGWTVFVALWVLVTDFAPLWLVFLVLVNATFVLYWEQVSLGWPWPFACLLLLLINTGALLLFNLVPKLTGFLNAPWWLTQPIALAAVFFATSGLCYGLFEEQVISSIVLLIITAVLYTIAIKQSLQQKHIFYLVIVPFSIIIIICALLIKLSKGSEFLIVIAAFIIVSITLGTRKIISLQKKWANE